MGRGDHSETFGCKLRLGGGGSWDYTDISLDLGYSLFPFPVPSPPNPSTQSLSQSQSQLLDKNVCTSKWETFLALWERERERMGHFLLYLPLKSDVFFWKKKCAGLWVFSKGLVGPIVNIKNYLFQIPIKIHSIILKFKPQPTCIVHNSSISYAANMRFSTPTYQTKHLFFTCPICQTRIRKYFRTFWNSFKTTEIILLICAYVILFTFHEQIQKLIKWLILSKDNRDKLVADELMTELFIGSRDWFALLRNWGVWQQVISEVSWHWISTISHGCEGLWPLIQTPDYRWV